MENLKAKALEDFRKKYPTVTSGDLQTFILGLEEGIKIGISQSKQNK